MSLFKSFNQWILEYLNKARDGGEHGLSDFDRIRLELQPCDVLLIEGTSRADRVVQQVSRSPWSHAALYIGRLLDINDSDLKTIISHFFEGEPDVHLIIESCLGEGIVVRPLHYYEHDHLRICRPKSLNSTDISQIIRFAINRLGAYPGGSHLFDLVRFFFPWNLVPLSWRGGMFRRWAGRHTKNVTAAFIAECFGFIQFPVYPLVKTNSDQGVRLLRRHPKLCMPNEIDQSPNFEIVKYPFIDFRQYDNERLIPWKGSGIYSGMDQDLILEFKPETNAIKTDNEDESHGKVTPINSRTE